MTNDNLQSNLSISQIIKVSLIALLASLIISLIAVLPAEYGKDYTGLGKLLGFSRLYQEHNEADKKMAIKEVPTQDFKEITIDNVGSGSEATKPIEASNPAPSKQSDLRTDSVKITIPAGKGLEYKIAVLKYGQVKYAWKTANKAIVFVDLHGDVKTETKNSPYYESYVVANSNNMAGSFIAPFEGKHGWYFKNRTTQDIEIIIHLTGQYQIINN